MKAKVLLTMVMISGLWMAGAVAQSSTAADLYQEALHAQEVKGDLVKAIELYRTIVSRYAADKVIAPKALLEMAGCYEKLGRPEAEQTYQRIVNEYGTSGTVAAAARTKLAALTQKSTGLIVQRISGIRDMGAVSPDGRYMTYGDVDWNLHVQDLRSGRDRKLTACLPSPEFKLKDCWVGSTGVFSPDSRWLAYKLDRTPEGGPKRPYELRVISRDGGEPRVIHQSPDSIFPVGWTPDGKWILAAVYTTQGANRWAAELIIVSAAGGQARSVRRFTDQSDRFRLSPDGRSVLFDRPAMGASGERDLFVLSIDDGSESAVVSHPADEFALEWFPEGGRILFGSDRGGSIGIWSARIVNGRIQGEPVLIQGGTGPVGSKGFTDKGWLYYGVIKLDDDLFIATLDPASGKQAGELKRLDSRFNGGKRGAAWSPDGKKIVFVNGPAVAGSRRDVDRTIAIHTMATGSVDVMPFTLRNLAELAWTPDGRAVLAPGQSEGRQGLFKFDVETRGLPSIVETGSQSSVTVSPDGQRIFSIVRRDGSPGSVAVRDTSTGTERILTNEIADKLALSPDGRWLALSRRISTLSNSRNTIVIPSSGGEPRPLAAGVRDWSIQAMTFSADGRFLFVVKDARGELGPDREIWQVPLDGSEPRDTGIRWPHNIWQLSAHPDGRRLLISSSGFGPELWVLQNIPPQR